MAASCKITDHCAPATISRPVLDRAQNQDLHTNSSVRYLAESALARWMRSARSSLLSCGGGAVRLSTGSPTAMKNSSCPAGVHMQSRRAGLSDMFLNEWGAL